MKRLLFLLTLTCALAGCHLARTNKPLPSPDPATLPQAGEYFNSPQPDFVQKQVDQFREDNKTRQPGGIVFCGDSITAGFPFDEILPDYKIANRGIGGDSIWGLIRRLDVSAYELRPRQLFLMIAVNDIFMNKMTPPQYGELYHYILCELQKNGPDCKIYVQSILPVRGKIANIESEKLNATIREVNRELEAVAEKHGVKFLNIHPLFCDEKGEMKPEYSDDGVHPNRAGYEAWARQIKRFLKK